MLLFRQQPHPTFTILKLLWQSDADNMQKTVFQLYIEGYVANDTKKKVYNIENNRETNYSVRRDEYKIKGFDKFLAVEKKLVPPHKRGFRQLKLYQK